MERFVNVNWREVLQLAPNVKAIEDIMREYVQAITPALAALPVECQKALVRETDVQALAVALLQAELRFSGDEDARALLHEVAYTFASAAVRVTLLHPRPAVSAG